MRQIVSIVVLAMILGSCAITAPEMRGGESFNMNKIDGKKVSFVAGATVYNGNWFGIKLKPSDLELYLDGDYVGTVRLDKKVKLKRKKETDILAEFTASLEDGAMKKAMGLAMKGSASVRMTGKVKAGVFIFSKKLDFDQTKTINTSDLKFR